MSSICVFPLCYFSYIYTDFVVSCSDPRTDFELLVFSSLGKGKFRKVSLEIEISYIYIYIGMYIYIRCELYEQKTLTYGLGIQSKHGNLLYMYIPYPEMS